MAIGDGITLYGVAYFLVHEVYFRGIRRLINGITNICQRKRENVMACYGLRMKQL